MLSKRGCTGARSCQAHPPRPHPRPHPLHRLSLGRLCLLSLPPPPLPRRDVKPRAGRRQHRCAHHRRHHNGHNWRPVAAVIAAAAAAARRGFCCCDAVDGCLCCRCACCACCRLALGLLQQRGALLDA